MLFDGGSSDPFPMGSSHHSCTCIGYQTPQFALLSPVRKRAAIASAARSTAPGGPSRSRTSARPLHNSSTCLLEASDDDSSFAASSVTRCGVKSSWINSGTTARPAIRFTMLKYLVLTNGFASLAVNGDKRYTTIIGFPSNAVSMVAVPLETIARSAAATAL